MRIESVTINGRDTFRITPDEGKQFMRVSDGALFSGTMTLGYTYFIGGVKLENPHWETPDDYIEVDAPEDEGEGDDSQHQGTVEDGGFVIVQHDLIVHLVDNQGEWLLRWRTTYMD